MPEICEVCQASQSEVPYVIGSSCSGTKRSSMMNTYVLDYVKYDFYKKSSDHLVVQIYVKEVEAISVNVSFQEDAFRLQFKTRSKEFFKLHKDTSEGTVFKWHVMLRHKIDSRGCKFSVSATKLTLTLKRAQTKDPWNSLEALNTRGASYGGNLLANGGSVHSNMKIPHCFHHKARDESYGNAEYIQMQKKSMKGANKAVSGDHSLPGEGIVNGDNTTNFGDDERLNIQSNFNKDPMVIGKCSHVSSNCNDIRGENIGEGTVDNGYNIDLTSNNIYACECNSNDFKTCRKHATNDQDIGTDKLNSTEADEKSYDYSSKDKPNHLREMSRHQSISPADEVCRNSSFKGNIDDQTRKDFKLVYDDKVHVCPPGATGLENHGNNCYINSVVQCLSSVEELRTYLTSKKYRDSVNLENKDGFNGDLVNCFGSLMEQLWSGKKSCVSATTLKHILGRKHKLFTYFGQGDAEEFLTFLLDGLHEDLKNDRKKCVGEQEAGSQQDVFKNGREQWKKFNNKNESMIIDLFYGQTVSVIRCKECNEPSMKFDPWMQLNLPIPNDPVYVSVYVFFLDLGRNPLQVKLKVCQGTRCLELLTEISKLTNFPAHRLVLLRSQYSRISHIYDLGEELSYPTANEILIACQLISSDEKDQLNFNHNDSYHHSESQISDGDEVLGNDPTNVPREKDTTHRVLQIPVIQRSTHQIVEKCSSCSNACSCLKHCSKCCRVAYCNSDCQKKHWKSHRSFCAFEPVVIGFPFVLSILYSQAKLNKLKKKALHYARFSVAAKEGDLELEQFQLTLLENLTDFRRKGKKLTPQGDAPVVDDNVCLSLDWYTKTPDRKVSSRKLICEHHESVNRSCSEEDRSCSLEECLKLYWNPDIISEESGWRCDHCKDIRPATRKTMLLRHPKNMIIHIKRFSYAENGRKITKPVHFPLRGLNMSPFTCELCRADEAIYDLQAICSHHGFMNFGHYVTYSRPYSTDELNTLGWASSDGWLKYDDSKVSCVSESVAAQAEAYILFYQRRRGNATSGDKEGPLPILELSKSDEREPLDRNTDLLSTKKTQAEEEHNNYVNSHYCMARDPSLSSSDSIYLDEEVFLEDQLD